MRIENILDIAVNDFQLCDIIHGRRKCLLVNLNAQNAPMLINHNADGIPIIENGKVSPIPYSKIYFHSTHISLTGESCTVIINNIRPLFNKNPHIKNTNTLNGHILCFDLGLIQHASTDADYTMQ